MFMRLAASVVLIGNERLEDCRRAPSLLSMLLVQRCLFLVLVKEYSNSGSDSQMADELSSESEVRKASFLLLSPLI